MKRRLLSLLLGFHHESAYLNGHGLQARILTSFFFLLLSRNSSQQNIVFWHFYNYSSPFVCDLRALNVAMLPSNFSRFIIILLIRYLAKNSICCFEASCPLHLTTQCAQHRYYVFLSSMSIS